MQQQGERRIVNRLKRQIRYNRPQPVGKKCQRNRRTGKQQDDNLLHDIDAPDRLRIETDRSDDEIYAVIDDDCQYNRKHKPEQIDAERDRDEDLKNK